MSENEDGCLDWLLRLGVLLVLAALATWSRDSAKQRPIESGKARIEVANDVRLKFADTGGEIRGDNMFSNQIAHVEPGKHSLLVWYYCRSSDRIVSTREPAKLTIDVEQGHHYKVRTGAVLRANAPHMISGMTFWVEDVTSSKIVAGSPPPVSSDASHLEHDPDALRKGLSDLVQRLGSSKNGSSR